MFLKYSIVVLVVLPVVLGLDGKQLIEYAVKQYSGTSKTLKTGSQFPTDGDPISPVWHMGGATGWTSGFYPGVLWYLYNYTKIDSWKQLAIHATDGMVHEQNNTGGHDIGFQIMCSYGNGYEFTKNDSYPKIIATAAHSLSTRFNKNVGCTRSWGNKASKEFLVIVDNMMNLELLFKGYEITGNKTLYDMAVSHANRTIKEHLRKDFSSFHVVAFNETNGDVIRKYTAQGYADNSTWARGQAWLVNGFTTTYRYTKSKHFLEAAKHVSNYYISHLPEDGVTYWDFNVPHDKYPYIPRDTSSASIAASGLFELYEYTQNEDYLKTALKIMKSLSSSEYRADGRPEYRIGALLTNGTTSGPNARKGSSDLSIIYGDYYFIKALKFIAYYCNYK